MKWHFAGIWETVADAVPHAPALSFEGRTTSWAAYEDRAARLASALMAAGVGHDSKAAIYAFNSPAWLEAQFAVFKTRAWPINVNYRYVESELVYLLDNSDSEALIFDAQFAPRVRDILPKLPKIRVLIEIDDGSGEHLEGALAYETLISQSDPLPRQDYSEDDVYLMYTGGTTGMPKGVMYRQGDFARGLLMSAWSLRGHTPPESAEALAAQVRDLVASGQAPVSIPACPLMHATGMCLGAMHAHQMGGSVAIFRNGHFDAEALWRFAAAEKASDIAIVGDAFARPMIQALEAARAAGHPHDLSALRRIISSGVMFSQESKATLLEMADITIIDSMGSSEGGMGLSIVNRETRAGETARFLKNPGTRVLTEDGRDVEPGSDEVGMIANGGMVPIGYYKDEAKTAMTFKTIDGQRYSFPGDYAKVSADGSLIVLGRGSNCINTGGEKVYPEEVEEALKSHPDVRDCLVVGVPDERFGQRIAALVAARQGCDLDTAALAGFVRTRLAGYKTPRQIITVGEVRRAANGKADYRWAREAAQAADEAR